MSTVPPDPSRRRGRRPRFGSTSSSFRRPECVHRLAVEVRPGGLPTLLNARESRRRSWSAPAVGSVRSDGCDCFMGTGVAPNVFPGDEFGRVPRVAGASQRFSFLLGLAAGKLLDVGRERRCHGGILALQRCSSVRSTGGSVSASEEVASRDDAVQRSHPSRTDAAVLVVDRRSVQHGLFRRHGAGVCQAT